MPSRAKDVSHHKNRDPVPPIATLPDQTCEACQFLFARIMWFMSTIVTILRACLTVGRHQSVRIILYCCAPPRQKLAHSWSFWTQASRPCCLGLGLRRRALCGACSRLVSQGMLCYAMLYHAPIAQEVHEAGDGVQLVELALVRVAAGPPPYVRKDKAASAGRQVKWDSQAASKHEKHVPSHASWPLLKQP